MIFVFGFVVITDIDFDFTLKFFHHHLDAVITTTFTQSPHVAWSVSFDWWLQLYISFLWSTWCHSHPPIAEQHSFNQSEDDILDMSTNVSEPVSHWCHALHPYCIISALVFTHCVILVEFDNMAFWFCGWCWFVNKVPTFDFVNSPTVLLECRCLWIFVRKDNHCVGRLEK